MQVSLLVEKVSRKQLGQLWDNQELSITDILGEIGLTRYQLQALVAHYKLVRRHKRLGSRPAREAKAEEPDVEEQAAIAARKAEIKASWTPNERAARCVGGRRNRCEIPHYRYDNNFAGFIGVSSLS